MYIVVEELLEIRWLHGLALTLGNCLTIPCRTRRTDAGQVQDAVGPIHEVTTEIHTLETPVLGEDAWCNSPDVIHIQGGLNSCDTLAVVTDKLVD